MAAPYRNKNILEMSNREREARRLADLERPGRDAIKGVYPEEYLIPAGAAALSKLKKVLTSNKKAPEVSMPPEKILHNPWKHVDNSGYDPVKELRRQEEAVGLSQAKKATQKAIDRSNINMGTDAVAKQIERSQQQDEQEYKRGGTVKSKSFRGDGIAQRGKTKGRFV